MDISPFYTQHWSITGKEIPGADPEDSAVELPGRNIFLIGLTSVWCSTHNISTIATGSLGINPFPDASLNFFHDFSKVISQGLDFPIEAIAPYKGLHKDDIIRKNSDLPLELTLTCLNPENGVHCGNCNKCNERQVAFAKAEVEDKTLYKKIKHLNKN